MKSDLCAAVPASAFAQALGGPRTFCTTSADDPDLPSDLQGLVVGFSSLDLSHMAATDGEGDNVVVVVQPLSVGGLSTVRETGAESTTFDGYPAVEFANGGTLSVQAHDVLIQVVVNPTTSAAPREAMMRALLTYGF